METERTPREGKGAAHSQRLRLTYRNASIREADEITQKKAPRRGGKTLFPTDTESVLFLYII